MKPPKFHAHITTEHGFQKLIQRLTSEEARKTKTFFVVGAGATQSESLPAQLRLPLASSLRDQLLTAHYNAPSAKECLQRFKKETRIHDPSPDQVWQFLIQNPNKLHNYAARLHHAFSRSKPIPATYHMLARWFFSREELEVGGVATTNFDFQLSKAFENVAKSLDKQRCIDYEIAEIPQDFRYFSDCGKDCSTIVQRLHGSLDRPWSIVAGSKESVYDISHHLLEYARARERNPFKLLQQLLGVLDPSATTKSAQSFYPYRYFEQTLHSAATIIFLGYSFQDKELVSALTTACSSNKHLYLVDPKPGKNLCSRADFLEKATLLQDTAERFLHRFVLALKAEKQLIQLPSRERQLLREGPRHVPGCKADRFTTKSRDSESPAFIDPIYGSFQFSEAIGTSIVQLVDTGEVQRLRQIKQLSFVNLKFHGATHDRFSHSLGVAHLADTLMSHWRRPQASSCPRHLESGDHLAFVAGALIHDIGHGPFGHTMDLVRMRLEDSGDHALDTKRIFQQIFTDKSFGDIDAALRSIELAQTKVDGILGHRSENTDILHSVLDNAGCDIDRLDFVLRDSAATLMCWREGTTDVAKDFSQLLKNYREILFGMQVLVQGRVPVVAFGHHLKDLLGAFARLYLRLYKDVYYCWQNVAAQVMIAEAVTEMVKSKKVELADVKPLTDVELLAALEEFENPKVAELAYLVKYRRLFSFYGEADVEGGWKRKLWSASDRMLVQGLCGLPYDKHLLVARLPGKKVTINFTSTELGKNGESFLNDRIESVCFGENAARVMVFAPPC